MPKSGTVLCMIFNPINDELITSTIEGFKIYCLKKDEKDRWKSLIQMCNYTIVLKREYKFTNKWIKKLEIDTINCHLYCCSNRDLYIFDLNGNLIRHYEKTHELAITSCVYSSSSKVVITGSLDNEIKIWSLTGGLIETLRGHTKSISKLILNPFNPNLLLSSSLDGTIKMWSLDVLKVIYELNLNDREILWIGTIDNNYLYVGSQFEISIWSISNFLDFWASSHDRVMSMSINYKKNKNPQIVAFGEENTIRIYSREKASQLTSILPLPKANNSTKICSIAYCRNSSTLYILIDFHEIWIFYTKTYPSSKVAIWFPNEIQMAKNESDDDITIDLNSELYKKKSNQILLQNLMKQHRAVELSLHKVRHNEISKCRCVGVLESSAVYWNFEGPCSPMTQNFLLLGLENGSILFCDNLVKDKKYFILNCSKDPVINIRHDKIGNYLETKIELLNLYHIQYWNLPYLEFEYEIFFPKSVTSYARLDNNVMLGYDDGAIDLVKLRPTQSKDSTNKLLNDLEMAEILKKCERYEHKQKVDKIDVCYNLKLFMSLSLDGIIKIWNSSRVQLAEIILDETLCSCSFLNSNGDLLVSWQNHLFKITLNKIIPNLNSYEKCLETNGEFDQVLEEDSYVMDDSSLKNELGEEIKIDLKTYLNPLNVKLNKDGIFVFEQNLKEKQKENKSLENLHDDESDLYDFTTTTQSQKSLLNIITHSVLSTPRENPLECMEKVDLTLNTKLTHNQIKHYLVEILTEYKNSNKNNNFPKNCDFFPKFGISPSSTPPRTPLEITPRPPEPEKDEKLIVEIKPVEIEKHETKKTKKRINRRKKGDDEDMEKKIKDRMPNYDGTKIKDAKINSKDLIQKASSTVNRKEGTKDTKPNEEINTPILNRQINKRKIDGQRRLFKKTEASNSDDYDESVDDNFQEATTIKLEFRNVKIQDIKSLNKSKNSTSNSFNKKISSSSALNNQNSTSFRINKTNQEQLSVSTISNDSKQVSISTTSDKKTESQHSLSNETKDTKKIVNQNEQEETQNTTTIDKFKKQKSFIEENKEELIEKTKLLFEYLYGKRPVPKRVTSAHYKIDFDDILNLDYQQEHEETKQNLSTDKTISKLDTNKHEAFNNNIYFTNWIKNYELQKIKLNARLNQVKQNHNQLLRENLIKWSESINRKNSISKLTYHSKAMQNTAPTLPIDEIKQIDMKKKLKANITNRKIQSASVHKSTSNESNNDNIRPKSVSFSLKANKNLTQKSIPVIHIQQPYMVSHIEMEEILNEVRMKVESTSSKSRNRSKIVSSVSFKDAVDIESDSDNEYEIGGFSSTMSKRTDLSLNSFKKGSILKPAKSSDYYRISSSTSQKVKFDDFDCLNTEYRLSSKSSNTKSILNEQAKSIDFLNSDTELNSDREDFVKNNNKTNSNLKRSRTPNSIPSKRNNYALLEYPELNLEYELPDCPEKYLLPIRFPILYKNVINSIIKIKTNDNYLKNKKIFLGRSKVI